MLFYAVPAMGLIGLLYTLVKFLWVSKQDAGNPRMKEISDYIAEGAMAFLKAEWKILAYFVVIVAILLGFMAQSNEDSHWSIAISFVIGLPTDDRIVLEGSGPISKVISPPPINC